MSTVNLDRLFNPRRLALIGVGLNPRSVGGRLLANLVGGGFGGVVYPVNPGSEAVLGIPCFQSLAELPRVPDLALICSAADTVPGWLRSCAAAGIMAAIVVSAGFRETGPEGLALEREIEGILRENPGMRVLGPNCLGVIVPRIGLNASFAPALPRDGNIAFISQSGALCTSILDWALEGKIGFSHFISIGNALDIDFADLIDYLGEDEKTHSIILYIESISRARRFMTATRAFARSKPIVVYKAGRFPLSAQAAASHTGAMAAADSVYDAAFQRSGLARVFEIGEIFSCVELIGRKRLPAGPKLGLVTNAGGPGVMAVDALLAAGGSPAVLDETTMTELNQLLPPFWSRGNPVDVLGDAPPKRIARAVETVLQDKGVDAVLVILTPQAMTNPSGTARAIGQLMEKTAKPVLAVWMGGQSMREGIRILNESGAATFATPEQAVRAFMTLVDYERNLESLYQTPIDIPVTPPLDPGSLRTRLRSLEREKDLPLDELNSKQLLAAYGIPVALPVSAPDGAAAVAAARGMGYPVVLKINSPDISHKTEVNGVALDLRNDEMVLAACANILAEAARRRPQARLEGVTVQPMINSRSGIELILGIKKDPVFGTVIMVGQGGTSAEIFADTALGFPPLNERLARRMLESLKIWPLLQGYRGAAGVDIAGLCELLIRLSYLAADFPEIAELDINPLLVDQDRMIALDARVLLDAEIGPGPDRAYSHLALRPYPEHYLRQMTLPDGGEILLRPIKPEDEPLWMELLGSCSRESIYARFRYFFHWQTHQAAVRYCYIDYDREMAIVAETDEGKKRLLGVGRLVADPDHSGAEYAVLVSDAWQNRGLGKLLTEYCLEIAADWGIKKVTAQTTSDNHRMIKVFDHLGFARTMNEEDSLVEVALDL